MSEKLKITDSRTSKEYEAPITEGMIKTLDLRKIKESDDDFGMIGYDPAFMNTAACKSAITYLDGEKGILLHRGYPIEQLAENSNFLETAYLLIHGELPNASELKEWEKNVMNHSYIHENTKRLMESLLYTAHPMGVLISTISALSTYYPEAKNVHDPEVRMLQIYRILGKIPTIAAFSLRRRLGWPYVYPDNDKTYTGNFLSMLLKRPEKPYFPNPLFEKALDVIFILHADHEQNCSTTAMRCVGSSLADPYVATAAAAAALSGPLHGGANERVLEQLNRIGSVSAIPEFIKKVKAGEERLMGFGHRVYKNYDPRARIMKNLADEIFSEVGPNPLINVAKEVERIALEDDYFISHKLYPNVDFYSGMILEAIHFPTDEFTVLFALARTAGWIAQWLEMLNDTEQKIARPRQMYTGPQKRDYINIDQR